MIQQGQLTFTIMLIRQKHDQIKSFPHILMIYGCMSSSLLLPENNPNADWSLGRRVWQRICHQINIILLYYLWTFDRLVLILTVVRGKVHPVSAQYRTHAIVFKGCLASPVGSESVSCLKSSPVCSSKSLIKSRSYSHLPVLVCLISCCHISFPFGYIIHQASSPLPR